MTLSIAGINRTMRSVGLADESQFFFKLADLPDDTFLVESVSLNGWSFHQDFALEVKVLTRHRVEVDALVSQTATFFVSSGGLVPVHGVITRVENANGNGDYRGLTLTLGSVLALLQPTRHSRVFVDQSALAIAQRLLKDPLAEVSTLETLAANTVSRPLTVQFEESDFDFVTRILAREGVFIHLHQAETETIVQLADALGQLAEGEHPIPLRYAPNAGAAKNEEHVFDLVRHWQARVGTLHLADTNPWSPEDLSVEVGINADGTSGERHHWGLNYETHEDGQHLAQVLAQAEAWPAHSLTLATTSRSLRPGSLVELVQHPDFSGHYRVIEVQLKGSQRAAAGNGPGGQDQGFQCEITVIPADQPYRASYHPRPPANLNLTAWITDEVDDRGLYRVRLPFDARTESDGPASLPVRMAQPLGGSDYGQHFPLAEGTEVVLGFENGDLDRPVILGAHYNQASPNPVTSANARQNLIRTRAGQRLLMDDTPEQERIELANPEDANQLTLRAGKDAHLAKLASTQGDITLHAGRAMTLESGENQTTTVGADHSVQVHGNQSLMTQEGKISVEAATDIEYSAGQNLRWQSREGEMTVESAAAMHWQVGNGITQQVDQGDYQILVQEGALQVEANTDITFYGSGNGSIRFQQGSTLVQMDDNGFTVDAGTIELTADTIAIKGGTIGNN